MEKLKQIFHPYYLWEDYKLGFYDNISGKNKQELINKVVELFSNQDLTEEFMQRVINEWIYSCEHNLTNYSMNRVAYLGQAACCIYAGVPSFITMNAWNLVDKKNRDIADFIANKKIKQWERLNSTLINGKKEVIQMEFLMKPH